MELLFCWIGFLLFSWHHADSQGPLETQQRLTPILASVGDTVSISCNLPGNAAIQLVTWYKEKQDKTLHETAKNYTGLERKKQVNLPLFNVQKHHSGVYYCAAVLTGPQFTILDGSRLIVSDASRPGPSLLIPPPSSFEGDPVNHSIPLLCLFIKASPSQEVISWDINGETSQDHEALGIIDGEGEFSLWSFQLIPPERWSEGATFTCSDQEDRNVSAIIPKTTVAANTDKCFYTLYVGLPFIVLLLLLLFLIFLFRKRLARAKEEEPTPQVHVREIPQTEYADIHQIQYEWIRRVCW